MKTPRVLLLIGAAGGCVTAGCVTTYQTVEVTPDAVQEQTELQSARNLPQAFTVATPARAPGDCPPRLSDPVLRTALTLVRSVLLPAQDSSGTGYRAFGDYSVTPAGRYGDREGDGLRVDCVRLRALGVISLRD